ncbi:MAG: hypothetical protein KAW47_11200 [Thermoplasmatales archaeon]|nr:hypothetical protein [Thermoplasmatales archaeon]
MEFMNSITDKFEFCDYVILWENVWIAHEDLEEYKGLGSRCQRMALELLEKKKNVEMS